MQWNISGTDVTQLPTAWTDQVKDHEQQSSNKTSDGIRLEVVLYHLQDVSLPEHVLPNPRAHDECGLMAAEIPTTAVCHVSGNGGQFAKDCWYQANKGSEKCKEGKKDKKGQRKRTKPEEADRKEGRSLQQLQRDWSLCIELPKEERVKQCKLQRWR